MDRIVDSHSDSKGESLLKPILGTKILWNKHMEGQLPTIIFTTLFLLSTTAGHPFPPTPDDTNFIRTSCEATRYPETCFTSLSGYAGTVQQDSGRLARVAIHVALSNTTLMFDYISLKADNVSTNTTESAAIHDCSSVFGDAVDEIQKSHREMKRLGWTGESVRFQLSNVQTWMSAALTNEDTCVDGFQEVAGGEMKADVCGQVVGVKQVTSNALALVNTYANKISS